MLKGAWGYPGWVMSDWGATPSWEFALEGLDQPHILSVGYSAFTSIGSDQATYSATVILTFLRNGVKVPIKSLVRV